MINDFSASLNLLDLKPNDSVLLSPFAPKELFDTLLQRHVAITFFDTTLQGSVDLRQLAKLDLKAFRLFIHASFFGFTIDTSLLQTICNDANLEMLCYDDESVSQSSQTIHDIYTQKFSSTKDFSYFANATNNAIFPLFLEPLFFCPKDDIITALGEKAIKPLTIKALNKDRTYLESHKELTLFGAHECQLSFLGLPYDVSEEEASFIAESLLEVLAAHSFRRCSF